MNRLDRVTAILIQLQSKKIVKAQEFADRFEISLRTVYRDIRTLEEAGIPLVGEAGIGYSIMEGYRLPPVMFTREEATSFLLAEKIVEKYTDKSNSEQYRSALFKIKAVLKTSEKEYLEDLDSTVAVIKDNFQDPTSNQSNISLQELLLAIRERTMIQVIYLNAYAQNPTTRTIEPIGTYLQNNRWYLIAYCRMKQDYRTFRTDRIKQILFLKEKFTSQHPPLAGYIEKLSMETKMDTIVIRVDKEIAKYIITEKYYHGFVSETDCGSQTEMTFLTPSLEGFSRWYLMFASNAKIVRPSEMKTTLQRLIAAISKNI